MTVHSTAARLLFVGTDFLNVYAQSLMRHTSYTEVGGKLEVGLYIIKYFSNIRQY